MALAYSIVLFLCSYIDSINLLNEAIKMINTYAVIKTSDVKELDANQVTIAISRTDGKKGKSGLCAVVDAFGTNNLQAAMLDDTGKAWMIDAIEALRARMASELNKAGKPLNQFNLGYDAVIAAMRQESMNQRMTAEAIGAWFDGDLSGLIGARIQEKIPTIASDKLAKLVEGYKDKFQSLSGRNVSMNEQVKGQLLNAFSLLGDDYDSVIGNKVLEKLMTVTEATEVFAAL